MRSTSRLALALVPLLACSPGDNEATSSETSLTTAPGTSSTGASTTAPTTTGEPITTTGEPGSTSSTSTTDATSSTTSSTSGITSGITTGVETTGIETTGTGSSSDTGVTPANPCVTDKDCHLHDDCCDCYGLPVGQDDPDCDLECKQSTCSMLGIDQAICRFGVCIAETVDCDGSNVTCKSLPPKCDPGSIPGVAGDCWTGECVPIANCNAVPGCDLCPAGTMCVQKISKKQTWPSCEPIPAECNGEIDCECAGTFVCTGSFNICNDLDGNELSCGCPAC